MVTSKFHKELILKLKKHKGEATKQQQEREISYVGTKKSSYVIKTAIRTQIVKNFIKKHPDLSFDEFIALLTSLSKGKSHDEISMMGTFLAYLPKYKTKINPLTLDHWLDNVEGWAEVDGICQSKFSADEMLKDWSNWKKLLLKLAKDNNFHKKRASLVLLTKPIRDSNDSRLKVLAFVLIDALKREKSILITKAISWLLRDLVKYHKREVRKYLELNQNSLPKIAIRETKRKIETGRKN